jgi:flagellar operon protein
MADPTRIQRVQAPHIPNETSPTAKAAKEAAGANSFVELLRARQGLAPAPPVPSRGAVAPAASESVRFSAHAQTRLQSRQIALEAGHLDRLQGAVQRAASKGARDALVLMDDLAMVVSVVNRTVVTVVDKDNLKQNVFTNIDSAVIA